MARAYDEYAYGGDIPGWYGPARQISGDLLGVTADGHLIAASGGGQQLYDVMNASTAPGTPVTPVTPGATAGDDLLQASASQTEIHASGGNDTVTGWSGQDYLRGDDGNDSIQGGSAFDDINGNAGNDTAHGGPGDDWVVGGKDQDFLYGDGGADIVYGNLGDDSCDGGAGADLIRGGQGNDVLTGSDGADWLSGDRGNDTITGGAGADIFHSFVGAGIDRVIDFRLAEGDRVQLDPGTPYAVAQVGADTVITLGGSSADQVILVGVQASTLTGNWLFAA
jgi:Ca2+-binding RTX toxin-like protein